MRSIRFLALAALLATALLMAAPPARAAGETISESTFNAGGHPAQGVAPASASFRISLGSIGEALGLPDLAGAGLRLQPGWVAGLRPPGEVLNLRFTGPSAFTWNPEISAGAYNVSRGALGTLPGSPGACLAAGLAAPGASDGALPAAPGTGFFYLVTVRNRLGEEGGKGAASSGQPRLNPAPCP